MLDSFYERAMKVYTEGKNRIELHKARTQFFEWAGQFDESSHDFEVKMSLFTDWYLLDRPYSDGSAPIFKMNSEDMQLPDNEQGLISSLQECKHSVFEFLKTKKDKLYIKDLFDGQKYLISDFTILSAFTKEQFFEARVIEFDEKLLFTGSFCFHPPQASKYILKEVKALKKRTKKESEEVIQNERKQLINKLFRMKFKTDQYKHIKIEDIYCDNSKVKV